MRTKPNLEPKEDTLRRLRLVIVLLAAALGTWPAWAAESTDDPLAELGIHVTSGAAAGYVDDAVCRECHVDKAESFADVGMSRSFYRPSADNVIEDFANNHFHHLPSDRHYEMELRGDEYWFRRYRLARDGRRIDIFERKIDWILGSGNHTRVYLYQTADGAMFQLPLAWYTQDQRWDMAPGFEWKRHLGVMRTVHRQCMFCHNAFPEVAEGSDMAGLPELFPHTLPEGIGCQRCHGPGAAHVRALYAEDQNLDEVRAAIVNPGKLPRDRLYSICYGCHMQPAVAMTAIRKFGRAAYAFRPGELLTDFRIDLDITERGKAKIDRFEINHHPYRLEQSRCFIESGGKLGCLTCHDPHRKIKPAERAAHYRKACLSCHGDGEGQLQLTERAAAKHPDVSDGADCTLCHMPERRTQDVIHVTMTDHLIARNPGGLELIAPIEKKDADIDSVLLRLEHAGLGADEATIYKAMGVLHYSDGRYEPAAESLENLLRKNNVADFEPWLALAESHLKRRKFEAALQIATEAEKRAPGHTEIVNIKASALYALGEKEEAIALLQAGSLPGAEQQFRLAVMKLGTGDRSEALRLAHAVLSQRDNYWIAWRMIGEIHEDEGRHGQALAAFSKALAIEPDDDRLRAGMVKALTAMGREKEAVDYRD